MVNPSFLCSLNFRAWLLCIFLLHVSLTFALNVQLVYFDWIKWGIVLLALIPHLNISFLDIKIYLLVLCSTTTLSSKSALCFFVRNSWPDYDFLTLDLCILGVSLGMITLTTGVSVFCWSSIFLIVSSVFSFSVWTSTHFVLGPSGARLRSRDFHALLKTHWGPSTAFCLFVMLLSLSQFLRILGSNEN